MLSVPCPNCRRLLQVVDTSADRESQCPACGAMFKPYAVWGHGLESGHPPASMETGVDTGVRLPSSNVQSEYEQHEWAPEHEGLERSLVAEPVPRPNLWQGPAIGFLIGCLVGTILYVRVENARPFSTQHPVQILGVGFWTAAAWFVHARILAVRWRAPYRWLARLSAAASALLGIEVCTEFFFQVQSDTLPFLCVAGWAIPAMSLVGQFVLATLIKVMTLLVIQLKAVSRQTSGRQVGDEVQTVDECFDEEAP